MHWTFGITRIQGSLLLLFSFLLRSHSHRQVDPTFSSYSLSQTGLGIGVTVTYVYSSHVHEYQLKFTTKIIYIKRLVIVKLHIFFIRLLLRQHATKNNSICAYRYLLYRTMKMKKYLKVLYRLQSTMLHSSK